MPCQFAGTLESSEVEASAGHGYDSGLAATSRMPRRVGLQLHAQQCVATVAAEWPLAQILNSRRFGMAGCAVRRSTARTVCQRPGGGPVMR